MFIATSANSAVPSTSFGTGSSQAGCGSLILADANADPQIVATDLVGQAEHGYNSPVWLVTDHHPLAKKVMQIVPALIADLPEVNRGGFVVILCANVVDYIIAYSCKGNATLK